MNSRIISVAVALIGLVEIVRADPPPQPQMTFTQGANNTWNCDWMGVDDRTYFFQWSLDLETWHYAPLIEFGEGVQSVGTDASTIGGDPYPKYFVRLHYTDIPTADPDWDDFDADGVPNILEVTVLGTDPFKAMTDGIHPDGGGDSDTDGIPDALELHWFGNLTTLSATSDYNGNGIPDIFEVMGGGDPVTDLTAVPASRSNLTYDSMGRLTGVSGTESRSYSFDSEDNLQTIHE